MAINGNERGNQGQRVRVEGATEGSELRAAPGLEVRFDREQSLEPVLYRA